MATEHVTVVLILTAVAAWTASTASAVLRLRAARVPRLSYEEWIDAVNELYEELGPPTARGWRDPRKAWRRGESAVGFAMAVTR